MGAMLARMEMAKHKWYILTKIYILTLNVFMFIDFILFMKFGDLFRVVIVSE